MNKWQQRDGELGDGANSYCGIVVRQMARDTHTNRIRTLRWMTDVADVVVLLLQRGSDGAEQQTPRSQQREVIQYFYESKSGNIFTKENLRAINDNDQKFFESKKFYNDFCLLVNGTCAKPRSVARLFDGTYNDSGAVFHDPNFENIDAVMNAAQNNPRTKRLLEFIMPSRYEINNTTVKADIIRT